MYFNMQGCLFPILKEEIGKITEKFSKDILIPVCSVCQQLNIQNIRGFIYSYKDFLII